MWIILHQHLTEGNSSQKMCFFKKQTVAAEVCLETYSINNKRLIWRTATDVWYLHRKQKGDIKKKIDENEFEKHLKFIAATLRLYNRGSSGGEINAGWLDGEIGLYLIRRAKGLLGLAMPWFFHFSGRPSAPCFTITACLTANNGPSARCWFLNRYPHSLND